MKLLVPVALGLEAPVKRQLKYLGYGDCPAQNGRISLSGDWQDIARLNVFLRAGERVLLELACFPATNFDELYEGAVALPWEEFFSPHTQIRLDGKCVKSQLMAIKVAGGVIKKAIVNRLKERLRVRTLDEKGERAVVNFSIFENNVSISLDTSGDGLHKRGYRVRSYDAPLRETTASAMLDMSFFHPEKQFVDLFCGSGTLPIEAGLIAKGIAPGEKRQFDFTNWKCVPHVLERAREEAKEGRIRRNVKIFASDISPRAIELAKFHAERAGVADCIQFTCADVRDFSASEPYGILMSNPPYGERLGEQKELPALYSDLGRVFSRLPDWSMYLITAYAGAERAIGKRADKVKKLYNAQLECGFYSYLGKKPPKEEKLEK